MASQSKAVSSSMPSVTSAGISLPPPPVFPGSGKTAGTVQKKPTAVFQGSRISAAATSTVNTNSDITLLFSQVKNYMEQQSKTNQRILQEIEDIKSSKKPTEEYSTYMARTLDFATPGSSAH